MICIAMNMFYTLNIFSKVFWSTFSDAKIAKIVITEVEPIQLIIDNTTHDIEIMRIFS